MLANADLFLLLDVIVKQKLKTNSTIRVKKSNYELPAYSEFQADCNGYERGLVELRSYLQIKKEEV